MTTDERAQITQAIADAFRAGFDAGFASSREGFNGECQYDHLAPTEVCDDPLAALKHAALASYVTQRPWDADSTNARRVP